MRLRLIPREERFFDMFVEDAANVLAGARQLEAMLRTYDGAEARASEIRATEHRGDEISHHIGHRLEETFVTPFDREDIYALISGLDDVLDFIEEVADTFVLYRVEAPSAIAVEQAAIIVKQAELLHDALAHLKGFSGLDKYWIEIHRLENEGDRIVRTAIADLFNDESHGIGIIFNAYDFVEGHEHVFMNRKAAELTGHTPGTNSNSREWVRYRAITPEAVRDALRLYEYGFDLPGNLIDGAYLRGIILNEIPHANNGISTIVVGRPLTSRWLGDAPSSLTELRDMQTEVNFHGSYLGEKGHIELINR